MDIRKRTELQKQADKQPKRKYNMNYIVHYILLISAFFAFRNGRDWDGDFILYLIAVAAVADICFSKNKMNAIANWILIAIFAGILLLWKFCVLRQWVTAVMCGISIGFLAVLFYFHWKKDW